MQTGALIVAAGKSSRMVDFKPMLQLGSISIAQRVINNFPAGRNLQSSSGNRISCRCSGMPPGFQ